MSDSGPQLDERTIKKYEELITENHQRQKEAGQEFDKQAVYIAGGGLALTLAVAKDFTAFIGKQYFVLLLFTWLFFALTLLFNLISHRASSLLHAAQANLAALYHTCYISQVSPVNEKVKRETAAADYNSRWVSRLNKWSLVSIVAGMLALILYVFLNALSMPQPTSPKASDHQTKPGQQPDHVRGLESPATLRPSPPLVPSAPQPPTTQPNPAKSND
jgi:hypothetical protein